MRAGAASAVYTITVQALFRLELTEISCEILAPPLDHPCHPSATHLLRAIARPLHLTKMLPADEASALAHALHSISRSLLHLLRPAHAASLARALAAVGGSRGGMDATRLSLLVDALTANFDWASLEEKQEQKQKQKQKQNRKHAKTAKEERIEKKAKDSQ